LAACITKPNALPLLLLLQDVCVVLELRDATLLVPNLRKMAAVLAAIPKLEAFVAQVRPMVSGRALGVCHMLQQEHLGHCAVLLCKCVMRASGRASC
jgi:hypothetical protein